MWWVLDVDSVSIAGQTFTLDSGIVDTGKFLKYYIFFIFYFNYFIYFCFKGTSVLVGTISVVEKMKAAAGLPKIGNEIDCTKIATYSSITFTINGDQYTLSPYDYILQVTQAG